MTRYHIKKSWIQNFIFIIICICVFFGVRYSFMPVIVIGESMKNTYDNHDLLIGSKLSYKNTLPSKGDTVVVDGTQYNLDMSIIKRVIATPGDTISIKSGNVYVNKKKINEPYITEKTADELDEIKIKKNEVFLMGDNRNHSIDSRVIGPISLDDIQAKIIVDSPYVAKIGHIIDIFS